jgi:hypothetical protein
MVTNIQKHMDKSNTHIQLQEIALAGLKALFQSEELDHTKYPEEYHLLILTQQSIGWKNFLKGRLSKYWITQQDKHYKDIGLRTSKCNGTTWATNLIVEILNQWFNLWKMRCEDLHGKDKAEQREFAQQELHREVVYLFEQADQAPTDYHDTIYRNSLETQLDFSNDQNAAWLANWEPVIAKEIRANRISRRNSESTASTQRSNDRTYFSSESSATGAVNT